MKGLKILRKIFSEKRKERTDKELGRFLIQSSLSSSDDFRVQKSNVNRSVKLIEIGLEFVLHEKQNTLTNVKIFLQLEGYFNEFN